MQFCSGCGQSIERRVPVGEDRERHVCSACGVIHYQNPKMVVGCIVEHDGRILLCKRAIQPRRGYWTVPAGFLELGESAMTGAIRETREEAQAEVRILAPYAHFDVPHIGQAYIIYRAALVNERFGPGAESLEVELVHPTRIPWNELAFPVVRYALELVVEDLQSGRFRTHQAELVREQGRYELREHLAFWLEGPRAD
jgi:ADP-ribose/FAD diphosphatase